MTPERKGKTNQVKSLRFILTVIALPFAWSFLAVRKLRNFFQTISWEIAYHATINMLVSIGLMALVAYIATMHYYLILPTVLFLVFGWYLLYRIEYGYRSRRTFGEERQ